MRQEIIREIRNYLELKISKDVSEADLGKFTALNTLIFVIILKHVFKFFDVILIKRWRIYTPRHALPLNMG